MALTDATHRALRPREARSSRDDTALPVDFLPHRPRTGDRATAAHLGDRICKAVRPASSEMLALDPAVLRQEKLRRSWRHAAIPPKQSPLIGGR